MHFMQGDVLTRDDLYKKDPTVHAKMGLQTIFAGDFKSHSRSSLAISNLTVDRSQRMEEEPEIPSRGRHHGHLRE